MPRVTIKPDDWYPVYTMDEDLDEFWIVAELDDETFRRCQAAFDEFMNVQSILIDAYEAGADAKKQRQLEDEHPQN